MFRTGRPGKTPAGPLFRLLALLSACMLLGCAAAAEAKVPSFAAFAGIPEAECRRAENPETATLQCRTDAETVASYRRLLAEYGFLACGSWTLPAGEGYEYAELNAYVRPGAEDVPRFSMRVGDTDVSCHLFIQHFRLADGTSAASFTRSRGLECCDPNPPEAVPAAAAETAVPQGGWATVTVEEPCAFCRETGECRYCDGAGQVRDYMTELFTHEETWKECEKCGGSGRCPLCGGDGVRERTETVWEGGQE